MDWNQVLTIVDTNIALILVSLCTAVTLFLWAKGEATNDRREFHKEIREDRKDFLTLIRGIQDEMKDFHNRLCNIEERNRK